MKTLVRTTFIAAMALGASSASAATVIFSDNFNRADNNTVGNGWSELEDANNDVAVNNNTLRLRDNLTGQPDAAVGSTVIDATGYENITVTFDWRALGPNEAADDLMLSYALAPAPNLTQQNQWDQVFAGSDGGTSIFSESVTLGADTADSIFNLMFWTNVTNNNNGNGEGFRIDNLVVSGDAIAVVPLPASASLLLLGFGGLTALRRRKTS